jgi:AcrR family transcriptional regulator
MNNALEPPEGLRERKRRETFERIADVSLRMFLEYGYDATTLEAIASASGISRRTFFYYFKSKDDVLGAVQGVGLTTALRTAFDDVPADQSPLEAVCKVLPLLVARFESPKSILIDQIMRSSEVLMARKQAGYINMETALSEGLSRSFCKSTDTMPDLRMVAAIGISVLRLALDQWRNENATKPIAQYVLEGFERLKILTDSNLQRLP